MTRWLDARGWTIVLLVLLTAWQVGDAANSFTAFCATIIAFATLMAILDYRERQ